jgi:hypothetical protein
VRVQRAGAHTVRELEDLVGITRSTSTAPSAPARERTPASKAAQPTLAATAVGRMLRSLAPLCAIALVRGAGYYVRAGGVLVARRVWTRGRDIGRTTTCDFRSTFSFDMLGVDALVTNTPARLHPARAERLRERLPQSSPATQPIRTTKPPTATTVHTASKAQCT